MPAKGKSRVSPEQRRKIAAGRVAGQTAREIACEVGLSESAVKKQVVDPRTKTLIQRFKDRHEAELQEILQLGVESIKRRLKHSDPAVQCQATRDALRYSESGDPPLARLDPAEDRGGDFTLEELLVVYRRHESAGS